MNSFLKFFQNIFTSGHTKTIRDYSNKVTKINALEDSMAKFSDAELREKTFQFKDRLVAGATLDELLVEAFAVVREASKRSLNMRHYDVQLMGGMALHSGSIAEMRTGEGKTLVSTLSAYLNALLGKGVHIVTVNDYLASRDHAWMSRVHRLLGLSVGLIIGSTPHFQRRAEYDCDITYVTNSEIGFDYLRDNMRFTRNEMSLLHRDFSYAIVDEIDSILIDEARTPLVISGSGSISPEIYRKIYTIVSQLKSEDFEINEKHASIQLTDNGNIAAEKLLQSAGLIAPEASMYDMNSYEIVNHILQSLKAVHLFQLDKDYIVKDGEVLLVDEFTGRIMEGRRYSGGLHQAIEAKENVKIQGENQTLASITYQNFFRIYKKLSGMTGTAMTEANELFDIYKLCVISIPTHRKVIRKDHDDVVLKTISEKYNNIVALIEERHKNGQPILIGTTSIAKSEVLSKLLDAKKIKHNVLNAKLHEMEAKIIAEAGRLHAVTIATNMAGRGTDILLGGSLDAKTLEAIKDIEDSVEIKIITDKIREEHEVEREKVVQIGGLFVIGSERHESRRVDNQLRGRAGRLGDPGESKFFLSLQDDLLRIFGGEKIDAILSKLGFEEGDSIDHPMLNKVIAGSQKKLENLHYEMRKNVIKYDDIINEQRMVVYAQRNHIIDAANPNADIEEFIGEINQKLVGDAIAESAVDHLDLISELKECYGGAFIAFAESLPAGLGFLETDSEELIIDKLNDLALKYYLQKIAAYPEEVNVNIAKRVIISTLDEYWKDHMQRMSHLREAIHLRAYAQKDPFSEYRLDAFKGFEDLMFALRYNSVSRLMHLEIITERPAAAPSKTISPSNSKTMLSSTHITKDLKSSRAGFGIGMKDGT